MAQRENNFIDEEVINTTEILDEDLPSNEEIADLFANRPDRSAHEEGQRIQAEAAEREAERKLMLAEKETARKARIRGRKRATFVSGMVIAALVFTLYIFGAKALEITGLTGTIEAIAHLGIAAILMWLGVFAHRYIKHEIYSNL